jgi:hypothetical protein
MFVESVYVTRSFVESIFCFGLYKSNRGVWMLHKAAGMVAEKKKRLQRNA